MIAKTSIFESSSTYSRQTDNTDHIRARKSASARSLEAAPHILTSNHIVISNGLYKAPDNPKPISASARSLEATPHILPSNNIVISNGPYKAPDYLKPVAHIPQHINGHTYNFWVPSPIRI